MANVRDGRVLVETALRTFEATIGGRTGSLSSATRATLSIRPESWKLGRKRRSAQCASRAGIGERVYLGEMAQYQFAAGAQTLKIFELNPRFVELSPERELFASVEPEDVVALPAG